MTIIIEKETIQTIVASPRWRDLDQTVNSDKGIDAPIIVCKIPLINKVIPIFPKIEEIPMPSELQGQYQYYTCSDNKKLINSIGVHKFRTIEEYVNASKT